MLTSSELIWYAVADVSGQKVILESFEFSSASPGKSIRTTPRG